MVHLVPMTQQQYDAYLEWSIPLYAHEMVEAGFWDPAGAVEKSRQEIPELLPQGLSTPDQYFYTIRDDLTNTDVGLMWLGISRKQAVPMAVINDFYIKESHRRQGYGTQALVAAEEKTRQLGLAAIGLRVFGHNRPALALYQKLHYQMVSISMRKAL